MLAELAAANAAFSVIKSFVSNGKELSSCGKQISDFVFAKEQIEKKASKKKAKGLGGPDLEEFMVDRDCGKIGNNSKHKHENHEDTQKRWQKNKEKKCYKLLGILLQELYF